VYRWELDDAAQPVFDELRPEIRATLTAFMDAVVIVDPIEYQREFDEPADHPRARRLPFRDLVPVRMSVHAAHSDSAPCRP
jgi:hypothetical protein